MGKNLFYLSNGLGDLRSSFICPSGMLVHLARNFTLSHPPGAGSTRTPKGHHSWVSGGITLDLPGSGHLELSLLPSGGGKIVSLESPGQKVGMSESKRLDTLKRFQDFGSTIMISL